MVKSATPSGDMGKYLYCNIEFTCYFRIRSTQFSDPILLCSFRSFVCCSHRIENYFVCEVCEEMRLYMMQVNIKSISRHEPNGWEKSAKSKISQCRTLNMNVSLVIVISVEGSLPPPFTLCFLTLSPSVLTFVLQLYSHFVARCFFFLCFSLDGGFVAQQILTVT